MNPKFLLILSLFSVLMSCNTNKIIVNRRVVTSDEETMLVGRVLPNSLTAPEFSDWYFNEYDAYHPNQKIIKKLKGRARLYRIEIFFGTWDTESKEQLPRFLKIMDMVKYPQNKLSLYAVNKQKESFYGEQVQKFISKLPSFIVYRGSTEIGRIVGAPTENLELDLYKIITEKELNKKEIKARKKNKR